MINKIQQTYQNKHKNLVRAVSLYSLMVCGIAGSNVCFCAFSREVLYLLSAGTMRCLCNNSGTPLLCSTRVDIPPSSENRMAHECCVKTKQKEGCPLSYRDPVQQRHVHTTDYVLRDVSPPYRSWQGRRFW